MSRSAATWALRWRLGRAPPGGRGPASERVSSTVKARVEAGRRVLEDDLHLAPDSTEPPAFQPGDVLPAEEDQPRGGGPPGG